MSSPVVLFLSVVVFILQLHISIAQLGNRTYTTEAILNIYQPPLRIRGNNTRIVGGKEINIINVPWQVALFDNDYFICGGSIISMNWVLTAAHCVESGGTFAVRVGSPNFQKGGQTRFASVVVVHSLYNSNTMNHDIAMIRVRQPFDYGSKVRAVYLPKPMRDLPTSFFVSGWGLTSENGNTPLQLRGVTIRRISRSVCQQDYNADNVLITYNMICAAAPNRDSCQGDSGGPLVYGRIQHGIVSFGIGCARTKYPGVYTKVRRQYTWINKVVSAYGGQKPTWV